MRKEGNVYYPEGPEDLTHFKPNKFNNVLIILREPGCDAEIEVEQAKRDNSDWFDQITGELSDENVDADVKRKQGLYRNRFEEMLECVGIDREDLSKIAYSNIKFTGGGKNASKEYWDMPKETKGKIMEETIKIIENSINSDIELKVFVLWEIFNIVSENHESEIAEDGIKYKGKEKPRRRVKIGNVEYFEIFHPSYRRTIETKESCIMK